MGGNDCDVFGFTMITLALDFYLITRGIYFTCFYVLDWYWVVFEENNGSRLILWARRGSQVSKFVCEWATGYLRWWDLGTQHIVVVHHTMVLY